MVIQNAMWENSILKNGKIGWPFVKDDTCLDIIDMICENSIHPA